KPARYARGARTYGFIGSSRPDFRPFIRESLTASANICGMAQSAQFGRDSGLQARMLLTLFLLGLVYAVLIGVLFAAGVGAVVIAVVAGVLFLIQFLTSDKIALFSMGAREVTPQEAPQLHALIDRLCVQANLPKPRVAIADTAMPNAFAV